jgi:hypothetical protein
MISSLASLFLYWRPYTITISLYLIVFLILIILTIKRGIKSLFPIITLVLSLIFVFSGKGIWYVMYIAPFIVLAQIYLIEFCSRPRTRIIIKSLMLLPVLILVVNLYLLNGIFKSSITFDYFDFSRLIERNIEGFKGNICLSVFPDPAYVLKKNSNIKIYEMVDVSGFVLEKNAFLTLAII